jgi:DNA polymerase zeta
MITLLASASRIFNVAYLIDSKVSPTGYMFVKPEVRKGLLGRMLVELLETRVMVKQAMKGVKNDKVSTKLLKPSLDLVLTGYVKALKRILDARQLGLKYIANVVSVP